MLATWSAEVVGKDDSFVRWHMRTGLQAHLGGQLMVRAVELKDEPEADETDASVELTPSRARITYRAGLGSFFGLSFDAAVEFFAGKAVLSPEEFDALNDRFKAAGFTARALASDALRDRAQAAITRSLEEGDTLDEVIAQIRADELALGMSPVSHDALDTIVRTNVAVAYNAGKWAAYQDPDVQELRPFLEYVTAGDGRVRPTHEALDGKVFRSDSDEAAYYAPPLGFRCRCSMISRSQADVDDRGMTVESGRIPGLDPDEGWTSAPAPLAS